MVKRNKEKTSIVLSSYLLNRAKALVVDDEFGSVSDIISTALAEFLVRYDERRKTHEIQPDSANKVMTREVIIE